jgi:hypothetical protein
MWYYLKAYSDWWGKWRNGDARGASISQDDAEQKADATISEMIKTRATQQNAVIDRIVGEAEKAIEESKKTTENDEE